MNYDPFPDWFVKANPDSITWAKLLLNQPQPPPVLPPILPPVATGESYNITTNPQVIPAPGVLANDYDPQSMSFIAVLDEDPGVGAVVMYSNGAFTYSSGVSGASADTSTVTDDTTAITADKTSGSYTTTFTYKAYNGVAYSDPATVTLYVTAASTGHELLDTDGAYLLDMETGATILDVEP